MFQAFVFCQLAKESLGIFAYARDIETKELSHGLGQLQITVSYIKVVEF